MELRLYLNIAEQTVPSSVDNSQELKRHHIAVCWSTLHSAVISFLIVLDTERLFLLRILFSHLHTMVGKYLYMSVKHSI